MSDDQTRPEVPRSEPEIIPPGSARRGRGDSRVWISIDRGDGTGAHVKQPGPFSIAIMVIAVIVVVALILTLVLGVLLIWVPIAAAIAVGAIIIGYLRGFFRRPR